MAGINHIDESEYLPSLKFRKDMTKEEIAQWVIDNRYSKSENLKTSDFEIYHFLIAQIGIIESENERLKADRFVLDLDFIIDNMGYDLVKDKVSKEAQTEYLKRLRLMRNSLESQPPKQ